MPNKPKPLTREQKIELVNRVDELRAKEGLSIVKAMKRASGTDRSEQCYYNWRKEFAGFIKPAHTVNGKVPVTISGPVKFERVFDPEGNQFMLMRRAGKVEFFPAQPILDALGIVQ